MKITIKISVILTLMFGLMLPWASTVRAANDWTVTKTDDTNDGSCTAADCSLREAIAAAAAGDRVIVPPGTYNLWLSHLWINKTLTITGSGTGSTIIRQMNPLFRVFEIGGPPSNPPVCPLPSLPIVIISRLTVTGGHAVSPSNSQAWPGHIHGGGIHNHGILYLWNVTITGNDARPDTGGGIFGAGCGASTILINVTVKNNTTQSGGGGIANGGTSVLRNTIVADNSPINCSGTITSDGPNLQFPAFSDPPSCGNMIPVQDPLLGALTNGVYPLLAGSPAIDAGATGVNSLCPGTDQLGTARPQDGNGDGLALCDIGAFEFIPPDVTAPVIVADVAPPPNANGWSNTDVTVTWSVSDPESGIASSSGCGTTALSSETGGMTLTCSATNGASLSSSQSVTVAIDKTPPTVTYAGNAGTYTLNQTVNITCSAADNLSGVASTTCADINAPASAFDVGTYTFSATATDKAGNVGSGSTTFTVSNPPSVARVFIDGQEMQGSPFGLAPGVGIRKSFLGVNAGPVKVEGNVAIVAAERVIYKVIGVNTSFWEMMALPNSQLNTIYWLPWYNNLDLDTQLRFGNVSGSTATVHVLIGGHEVTGSPFNLAPGASTRKSFAANNGPVKIVSNVNIVAAERVIYKVNNIPTSFSELMALPNSQLTNIYWLPWYDNVGLDSQLRFANVGHAAATIHVLIHGVEMPGSPFSLAVGQSTRQSFAVNNGPVKIVSDHGVPIVAAERILYKAAGGVNTSFSEMLALPNSQLNTTQWLPWYNNIDLDTQLRIGNVSGSAATVHVLIGGVEMAGSPFILLNGESKRLSFAGINSGPVKIESDQNVVAAERVIYKVNNVNTSFSEMMGLPNSQLDSTYWLPWYNNVDLDTQLRFGMP